LEVERYKRPLIVTSAFHIDRTRLITDWILGDEFNPFFVSAPDYGMSEESVNERRMLEAELIEKLQESVFPLAERGDIKTIGQVLKMRVLAPNNKLSSRFV